MSELKLSAELLKLFESFYRRRLAEAGGAQNDKEELAIARDILQAVVNDGLTPTSDGGFSFVRRGARDWSDPTTVQAAQATVREGGESGRKKKKRGKGSPAAPVPTAGGRSKEMLQGLLMMAGVLGLIGWFVWPMLFGGDESQEASAESGAALAAEMAEASEEGPAGNSGDETTGEAGSMPVTAVPTLETEMLADIVDAGGVKTGPVAPRTLEIKGVSFIVQPVRVVAGDWPLPDDPRAVSWVYGTVVNYVLGLEATAENKQLLASLRPGDSMLLRMSTGPTYRFAYVDVVRVAPQASEIFGQSRPGLTLALLGDVEQPARIVIRAVYIPGGVEDRRRANQVEQVSVGMPVPVGEGLWLTCLGSEPKVLPGTPPGYVHLGVNYIVENRSEGGLELATGPFTHHVEADGLSYPAIQSSIVRLAGTYPPLPELLEPGQAVTTTAVYAVPEAAIKKELTWQFAPDPTGQPAVQVTLPPYEGSLVAQVTPKTVNLVEDRLVLTLTVQAPALHGVEITAANIKVEGGTVPVAGNSFPWRLTPGERAEFALSLIPTDSPVMASVLEQGFEIIWRR
jgi:hypothetical protein